MSRLEELRDLRRRIDQEITREVACRRRLGRIEVEAKTAQINPVEMAGHILGACADYYGVSVATLSSTRRTQRATAARMVAAWSIRTSLGMSYPEIGRLLQKDHSTIMYAVKRVESDPNLRAVAARLLEGVMAA